MEVVREEPAGPTTDDAVREAMRGVIDPELGDDVVDLGMYQGCRIAGDGTVVVDLALTTAACPLRGQLSRDVTERVKRLPGVREVTVHTTAMSGEQRSHLMARARWKARDRAATTRIPSRTRVLAISSGKGGVGKSSITVNLAAGLAAEGLRIGILDADIAGFSIPRMLGMEGRLSAQKGGEPDAKAQIEPMAMQVGPGPAGPGGHQQGPAGPGGHQQGSIEVLSMGFLSAEDEAVMWRGLMLNRAVQHFIEDAAWGDLDYLLVDMPPGTGDVQMGLARMLPRAEMIIVTTPALAAQKVAVRAADMARKGYLRVAGVVENMSGFKCDHGEHYDLFGSGGGQRLAAEIGAPLLARIPLEPSISAGGDVGQPAVLAGGPAADAWSTLVASVIAVAPVVEMSDCSARLFDVVAAGLAERDA